MGSTLSGVQDRETLSSLIAEAKRRHGQPSSRGLSRYAEQHGRTLSPTTINEMSRGAYTRRLTPKVVETLAWLAGVSEERVRDAARMPTLGPPFAAELPPDADLLTPHQRAAVVGVIRAMLQPHLAERQDSSGSSGSDFGLAARRGDIEPGGDDSP